MRRALNGEKWGELEKTKAVYHTAYGPPGIAEHCLIAISKEFRSNLEVVLVPFSPPSSGWLFTRHWMWVNRLRYEDKQPPEPSESRNKVIESAKSAIEKEKKMTFLQHQAQVRSVLSMISRWSIISKNSLHSTGSMATMCSYPWDISSACPWEAELSNGAFVAEIRASERIIACRLTGSNKSTSERSYLDCFNMVWVMQNLITVYVFQLFHVFVGTLDPYRHTLLAKVTRVMLILGLIYSWQVFGRGSLRIVVFGRILYLTVAHRYHDPHEIDDPEKQTI